MTEEYIADTIAAFGCAAADAERLGFDAVELHGAHGYRPVLLARHQHAYRMPLAEPTIGERARFAAEVVRAVRASIAPDFPLILRVSQWKQQDFRARLAASPQELMEWLGPLVEAGVDILHCSQRRFWEPEFPEVDGATGLNFAGWAKKLTGGATISVGSVGLNSDFMKALVGESSGTTPLDRLLARTERDEFDLIAVGRALISDANWARKVGAGQSEDLRIKPLSVRGRASIPHRHFREDLGAR